VKLCAVVGQDAFGPSVAAVRRHCTLRALAERFAQVGFVADAAGMSRLVIR